MNRPSTSPPIGGEPAAEPIGRIIAKEARSLASHAEAVSSSFLEKLQPVMREVYPKKESEGKPALTLYPPLFHDLRENFISIQRSLELLDEILANTEL